MVYDSGWSTIFDEKLNNEIKQIIMSEKIVRAKFTCDSVEKTLHWQDKSKHLYTAKFTAVASGSEENDKFFDATPSGNLQVGTFKEDHFEVGKAYYIDFIPAE